MNPRLREAVKHISGAVAALIGVGLFLQGAFHPDSSEYSLTFLVAALIWADLHVKDRAAQREKSVLHAFGVTEATLRSTFGLSEETINQLLNDPVARQEYALQLKEGLEAIARRHGRLTYGASQPPRRE